MESNSGCDGLFQNTVLVVGIILALVIIVCCIGAFGFAEGLMIGIAVCGIAVFFLGWVFS